MRAGGPLVLAALVAGAAFAEGPPDGIAAREPGGIVSILFENDTFADTDRYYSHGAAIAWHSDADGDPGEGLRSLGRALAPFVLPDARPRWGFTLGQTIHTPRDDRAREPDPEDRPFAGRLLGTLSLVSADERRFGSAELSLGVIGPGSGAEPVQRLTHGILGAETPRGWHRQIDNRLGYLASWERRWQWSRPIGETLEVGLVPAFALHAGNVQTGAAVGVLARVGRHLAIDFGPGRIRPALSGLGVLRPRRGLGGYLFAGIEGRAVLYDATLDGNRNGYWDVEREPFVAELPFGAALAWGPVRLSFTWVLRTKTFESQSGSPFQFGSLQLSARY